MGALTELIPSHYTVNKCNAPTGGSAVEPTFPITSWHTGTSPHPSTHPNALSNANFLPTLIKAGNEELYGNFQETFVIRCQRSIQEDK